MKSATRISFVFFAFLFMPVMGLTQSETKDITQSPCVDVETEYGPVTGMHSDSSDLCEYLGIPYAAPPVGNLRFAVPQPPEHWTDSLLADSFGPECMQYPLVIFKTPELTGSEDCLYLNVWQPTSAFDNPKPVMVFIHGGGYEFGSGSFPIYVGSRLASRGDVVVVNFNYRLGPLGSYIHPAFRGEDGDIANFGLHDQLAALKWVKKNIANFGGDPENITIFGESAGGMSMGVALVSEPFKGLYNKVIIESGAMMMIGEDIDIASENGLKMAEALGCGAPAKAADCLRKIDANEFFKHAKPLFSMTKDALEEPGENADDERDTEKEETYSFGPVTGDLLMPDTFLRLIKNADLPDDLKVIIGFNRDEATLFSIGTKIETEEEYAKVLEENLEKVTGRFNIDISTDAILKQYPASAYPDPKSAFVDLLTDAIFACPSVMTANNLSARGLDTYFYMFSKPPTNMKIAEPLGAFHGSELPFVFGNFKAFGITFRSLENIALSDQVIGLWSSFARDGTPVAEGIPAWPEYTSADGNYLDINVESTTGENLKKDNCAFFAQLIADHLK